MKHHCNCSKKVELSCLANGGQPEPFIEFEGAFYCWFVVFVFVVYCIGKWKYTFPVGFCFTYVYKIWKLRMNLDRKVLFISYNSFLIWQEIERTCFCYLNQDNNETNDLHCRKFIIGATWNDEMSVWETLLPENKI